MWVRAWRKFLRNKLAVLSGIFVVLLILTAYVGPFLLKYPNDGVDYMAV